MYDGNSGRTQEEQHDRESPSHPTSHGSNPMRIPFYSWTWRISALKTRTSGLSTPLCDDSWTQSGTKSASRRNSLQMTWVPFDASSPTSSPSTLSHSTHTSKPSSLRTRAPRTQARLPEWTSRTGYSRMRHTSSSRLPKHGATLWTIPKMPRGSKAPP